MKRFILLIFILLFFYFSLPMLAAECPPEEFGCASGTNGCIGDFCCAESTSAQHCIEGIDWGYCGPCYTLPDGNETCDVAQPANCNDAWFDQCCCSGDIALNCNVPPLENPDVDERIWLNNDCGRTDATINCNGLGNTVCNNTYYPPETGKCSIMSPTINGYSVSDTSIISGNDFSISVDGNCPIGLKGKCLIECRILDPDGYIIELDSWEVSGSTILPNINCNKIGNYILEYCGIFTDFSINSGWGSTDYSPTTISCMIVPESEPPTYSFDNDNSGGSLTSGEDVNVSVKWIDNIGLGKALLRANTTGSWQVHSSCSLKGSSDWCNITIDTTDLSGDICWNEWSNDTSNNLNYMMPEDIHCFNIIEVPDIMSPTYSSDSDNSGGSVTEGTTVIASTLWNDNKNLDSASVMHNETGMWDTNAISLSGKSQWYNYSLNVGYGSKTVCWYQDAKDTSGNKNDTMKDQIHCFTVSPLIATTIQNTVESAFESLMNVLISSSSEFSVKVITLAFDLLGIVILIILIIILLHEIISSA